MKEKKEKEVQKAKAPAKEKEVQKKATASDIIAKLNKDCEGLFKTSLGSKKQSIYKDNVLPNDEKGKKSTRKKLRNVLFAICSAIVNEKNKENKEKLIKSFNDFYVETYKVNDFSLASVCNENLNATKKEVILKALDICKK